MNTLEDAVTLILDRMPPEVTLKMRLDFLEGLVWTLEDNGTELYQIRKRWLRNDDKQLRDLAIARWGSPIASSVAEAEELLASALASPEYQGRAEERLHECREAFRPHPPG